jgi:biopolymer transport protein ExbB/TolQ
MSYNNPEFFTLRTKVVLLGIALGLVFIYIFGEYLSNPSITYFLFDRPRASYPFTIQNLMWLVFFGGLADLFVHYLRGSKEQAQVGKGLLPEDDETMLRSEDLGVIYKNLRAGSGDHFLQRLLSRAILQFQSSRSVDQANSILNSSLELYQHEIDLRYNMIRYVTWLIPTLGFIGTVIGIAMALGTAGSLDFGNPTAGMLADVTDKLGVAFYTTLLALLQSAVLVLFQQIAQAREEMALNRAGQYCLDNLINRLFEK